MGIEAPKFEYHDNIAVFSPGIVDVHGHPRVGDTITDVSYHALDDHEGKAGLAAYTETALASGITVMHAMPNEFIRYFNKVQRETMTRPFPISNRDRALFMERSIGTESRIRTSYYLGLDPQVIIKDDGAYLDTAELEKSFRQAGENAQGLKIYGAKTTGGNDIPLHHIAAVADRWHRLYPGKPIIMHLEDENVRTVLEDITERWDGLGIPIHIAHVSSREELEAVIWAKQHGMNVTCEVTPHHLFETGEARRLVGSYGCVKPSLKEQSDVNFLWENMAYIDIIASDCAPHKVSDKEGESTVWGIANHTVMMPLILGAVEEGRITLEEVYQKMVVNPRKRFNLDFVDGTVSVFDMSQDYLSVAEIEAELDPQYGQNVFLKLEELGKEYHLHGRLDYAHSGSSDVRREAGKLVLNYATDLRHLVMA